MHCSRCGSELVAGAGFCSTCGAPVEGPLLPTWLRVTGVLAALATAVVLVQTQVVPSQAEDVAADVVAGEWSCDLDYAETDENDEVTTEWQLRLLEDGRVEIESEFGEQAEGSWTFSDGQLSVDFGDSDLGNPELATQAIEVTDVDEIVLQFEPTADDRDEGVGERSLTCERDV